MFFMSMPGTGLSAISTSTCDDNVMAVFFA